MKQLSPVLARGLFYILAAALFTWSCSLTMTFLGDVLPHIPLAKYLGLIMFDLGALSWLFVFLKASQGLAQRAIALAMSLVDLAGAVLIGFAEIMLGGPQFAEIPKDLGTAAIWSIAVWTGLNLFAILVFHLMDPTAQREMAQRNAMDKITSQALDVLDKRTDELAAGVAGELAEAWCDHLLLELDVMRRSALRLPETIDARALDSLEEAARKSKPSKNGKEQERIYPVETEAGF